METFRLTSPEPSLFRRRLSSSSTPRRRQQQLTGTILRRARRFIKASISSKPTSDHHHQVTSPSSKSLNGNQTLWVPSVPLKKVCWESLQYPSGYLGAVPERTVRYGNDGVVDDDGMDYLRNIISSKVYDVVDESPLELAPKLSEKLGVNVWLKREDLQAVFSFKIRGAYNMMSKLTDKQLEKGVICSSAGNHALGVALSAKKLGCDAVICMPVTTPESKLKSVKRLGGSVVLVGDSYEETQAYAKKRGEKEGRVFVSPFDNSDVIAGQGTIGKEIVDQMQGRHIDAIFVPVGGGGLIAGIAAYVKRVRPQVKIIGVEPCDGNSMALALHHGERVLLDPIGGFADAVAIKTVGEECFRLCEELIDGIVLVNRDAICASIKDVFEEKRSILEPSGALALAGAEAYCKYYGLKGSNIVAVTSGANMNFYTLRMVTELANIGRKQEALLATFMPNNPQSFKKFCELVAPMNITEVKFRSKSGSKELVFLYSVGAYIVSELHAMLERMESAQISTYNLTENDLVKYHLRHMMGGKSDIHDEVLCRFTFPEQPGALKKFLEAFTPRWNITLFHYSGQGGTGSNALVGIQIRQNDMGEFLGSANALGYAYYVLVTDDNVFQVLMH